MFSVGQSLDTNQEVHFTPEGSWVYSRGSDSATWLTLRGNLFFMKFKVRDGYVVAPIAAEHQMDLGPAYMPFDQDAEEQLYDAEQQVQQAEEDIARLGQEQRDIEYRLANQHDPSGEFHEQPPDAPHAAQLVLPKKPSQAEVDLHNHTHQPFAPWCETCVMSRARDVPHQAVDKTDRSEVVLQWDYTYWAQDPKKHDIPADDRDVARPSLTGVCTATGSLFSTLIPRKGSSATYVAAAAAKWIENLGHSRVILRSDDEASLERFLHLVQRQFRNPRPVLPVGLRVVRRR